MNSLLQLAFFLFQLSDNLTPPNSRIVLSKTSHPQYFYAPLHVLVICAPASTGRNRGPILFVKVIEIQSPLVSHATSSWLHRNFISLSTKGPRVSICSLASSVALDKSVDLPDSVSLENWALSETFRAHYQCNPMTTVHFTTSVLDHADDAMVVFCDADKKTYSG